MYLTWLGHSCFKLQDKTGSDAVVVVCDPYGEKITGLKMPHFEADIVTISHNHEDHNNIEALRGDPFLINSAGEFEIKNVFIDGIDSFHDNKEGAERGKNIIYRIDIDDVVVTHLGDLGCMVDAKQLERMDGTDILLVPVGGKHTVDIKTAIEIINEIEPRIVIPMHYQTPGLKIDLNPLEMFIKEFGVKPEYEEKLKISKKDLPVEETKLIVLKF